jgi:5-methylcytosine-specific restriction protein A
MADWPYSTALWQRLRKLQLATEPTCRYCAEQGRTVLATEVDHVVPWRKGGAVWDRANLQSLCKPCHDGPKQREERVGERIGCDVNGIPLRGWG